jgi:hypothetical protein
MGRPDCVNRQDEGNANNAAEHDVFEPLRRCDSGLPGNDEQRRGTRASSRKAHPILTECDKRHDPYQRSAAQNESIMRKRDAKQDPRRHAHAYTDKPINKFGTRTGSVSGHYAGCRPDHPLPMMQVKQLYDGTSRSDRECDGNHGFPVRKYFKRACTPQHFQKTARM